jgi:hypothetical protein
MGVKVQYNPSTGKVSYNPATGKVQVVVDDAGEPCSFCDEGTGPSQVSLDISGITKCCQHAIIWVGNDAAMLDQTIIDLANATHILDWQSDCLYRKRYDISENVYVWNSSNDCSGDPDSSGTAILLEVLLGVSVGGITVTIGWSDSIFNPFITFAQWEAVLDLPCFDQTISTAIDTDCEAQSQVDTSITNWTPWAIDGSVTIEGV